MMMMMPVSDPEQCVGARVYLSPGSTQSGADSGRVNTWAHELTSVRVCHVSRVTCHNIGHIDAEEEDQVIAEPPSWLATSSN